MSRLLAFAAGTLALLAPATACAAETPSYLNEVVPLLTRLGCNQGACHGKGAGQNGFRLSLRGYAPDWDHGWLTREFAGRRINPAVPEESLILTKPLGKVPHEGGKLFTETSREYQTLLAWVTAGAPGPDGKGPELKSLHVKPENKIAKVSDEFALRVEAEFTDGSTRDVTWLARFDSNDPGIAEVTPAGKVAVRRNGETALRVSFQTGVAVVIVTVPFDAPVRTEAARNNFIDDHVFAKLAALRIEPSDLCDDLTFLRRAHLDLIGTLPTPDEVRAFLADKKADKRTRLVDELLKRPEFVDSWALWLGDLLQNRKERDHDVRGTKGVRAFHEWLRRQVEANRPWDELARDVLTATGTTAQSPQVGYFVVTVGEHREGDKSEVVGAVAQAFLGTRIGCAQCHNHPLERYTQDDYYHFAGFFSRIKFDRKDPKQGPTTLGVGHPDKNQDRNPVGVSQPRTGKFLTPRPLDRSDVKVEPGSDPRAVLAAWITDPKNEYFSGAMVNRLWKHFLGTGLVEPVDDLRASNPPTNPELWKALNKEFVDHKFDLKHLMRTIVLSRTYQLSATTKPGNAADTLFYSHFVVRRLTAEVLLDAICQATGVPESFPGYPQGVRAIQVPDTTVRSHFLETFGRPARVTACACERNDEVNLPQLLIMQNGETLLKKFEAPEGRLMGLLKKYPTEPEVIEELFLATIARLPTPAETEKIFDWLKKSKSRQECYMDVFWALTNTKEFLFNH